MIAPETVGDHIMDAIRNLVPDAGDSSQPMGLGIAVSGHVSSDTVIFSPPLGWRNVPLRQILPVDTIGLPVNLVARPVALATAEQWLAAGRKHDSFVVITIGDDDIEAGIVLGRTVLDPQSGVAGEIGHIPVRIDPRPYYAEVDFNSANSINYDLDRCRCGNTGCLETVASSGAIVRRYMNESRAVLDNGPQDVGAVVALAQEGDAHASYVLRNAANALARTTLSVMNLIGANVVILTGTEGLVGDHLGREIMKDLERFSWNAETITIAFKPLKPEWIAIGATVAPLFKWVTALTSARIHKSDSRYGLQ